MPVRFLKDLYRERSPLLEHILRFNLRSGAEVHPERLPQDIQNIFKGVSEEAREKLQASRRGLRRFSRLVEASGAVAVEPFYDFREPVRRLALLDGPTLEKLVIHTGAAACHPVLSRCVLRTHVQRLRESLGREVYDFAVGTAPFLIGPVPNPPDLCLDDPGCDPAVMVRRVGVAYVRCCLADEPPLLSARLECKLPPGLLQACRTRAESSDHCHGYGHGRELQEAPSAPVVLPIVERDWAWRVTSRVLVRHVAPQWAPFLLKTD